MNALALGRGQTFGPSPFTQLALFVQRGRPRKYPFGALAVGQTIGEPYGQRSPERTRLSLVTAARQYRDTHAPDFTWTVFHTPHGVALERMPDGLTGEARDQWRDRRTLDRLTAVSKTRELIEGEIIAFDRALRAEMRRRGLPVRLAA